MKIIYDWLANYENEHKFNRILDQFNEKEAVEVPNNISRINSWKSIANKIAQEEKVAVSHKHRNRWRNIGKFAAVFIILAMGFLIFINQNEIFVQPSEPNEPLAAIIKQTEKGQKRRIELPDGSWVTLNSASSLEVSPDFKHGNSRTVLLKGEAYFEIQKMPAKPFIVKTEQLTTKVLGTSFNVEAYQANQVKVAVSTGKVQVSSDELSLDLVPNEMAVYKKQQGILKTKFDAMLELGWKDGYLVFSQADFNNLVNKLELWYGVNVIVKGKKPRDTFTARYHNISLENVLEGLSFSGDFSYQLNDNELIIEFK
ncbi:MAG: FecR family protein [Candidatus Cyclobacteriaceae bacterium M3_2C_046]